MVVVMGRETSAEQVEEILDLIESTGAVAHLTNLSGTTVIGITGTDPEAQSNLKSRLYAFPSVEHVLNIAKPYKLASRDFKQDDTIIDINGEKIGGNSFVVIAGPCSVESREGILEIAEFLRMSGANLLRGGAFKPRSSPYSFQGLGIAGLQYLAEARERTGLPIVSEVLATDDVDTVAEYADVLQIGARNMQNVPLLNAVSATGKPILLKRGVSARIEELLLAAEYILKGGNAKVILCERGIRTFETATRNTLDITAIPVLKSLTHLPVIVDPSHASGMRQVVPPLARASLAVGADGLMVEVHKKPAEAKSDGAQSIDFEMFAAMIDDLRSIAPAVGKQLRRSTAHSTAPVHV